MTADTRRIHVWEFTGDTVWKPTDGTPEAKQWLDTGHATVLAEGEPGLQRQIAETLKQVRSQKNRESLTALSAYFANHSHHSHYAEQLADGRSIGKSLQLRDLLILITNFHSRRIRNMPILCHHQLSDVNGYH